METDKIIPIDETERQVYFCEKAIQYVTEQTRQLGRKPTFCVTTFGCQMNPENGICKTA